MESEKARELLTESRKRTATLAGIPESQVNEFVEYWNVQNVVFNHLYSKGEPVTGISFTMDDVKRFKEHYKIKKIELSVKSRTEYQSETGELSVFDLRGQVLGTSALYKGVKMTGTKGRTASLTFDEFAGKFLKFHPIRETKLYPNHTQVTKLKGGIQHKGTNIALLTASDGATLDSLLTDKFIELEPTRKGGEIQQRFLVMDKVELPPALVTTVKSNYTRFLAIYRALHHINTANGRIKKKDDGTDDGQYSRVTIKYKELFELLGYERPKDHYALFGDFLLFWKQLSLHEYGAKFYLLIEESGLETAKEKQVTIYLPYDKNRPGDYLPNEALKYVKKAPARFLFVDHLYSKRANKNDKDARLIVSFEDIRRYYPLESKEDWRYRHEVKNALNDFTAKGFLKSWNNEGDLYTIYFPNQDIYDMSEPSIKRIPIEERTEYQKQQTRKRTT